MARRTYGESDRKTVERSVRDRKVIERFTEELGADINLEKLLNGEDNSENVEATAKYRLVHPYEAENFSYALMHGEEVTARVNLFVELPEAETQIYTGEVSYNARYIFNPASVVGIEDQNIQGGHAEFNGDNGMEIEGENPASALSADD